ncbi:MAG TPA: ABC transporter ATP-binding protein, partial [Desulfobacterales bacterium]|nr:ABC transporter ATP-binding protein [Desulfobacterales bacterium]
GSLRILTNKTEGRIILLLEGKNIAKRFGGLLAINKLDFHIKEGEILGVIGPNGSGKSTLFNLLTGFLPVTSGEILYQGRNITRLPNYSIGRLGLARTFQTTRIFANETVWDNITVGVMSRMKHSIWHALIPERKRKESDARLTERCREILDIIGLEDYVQKTAGTLDQEKQKRVAMGIALATEPKLLLLDEPTGGINVEEISQLINIIQRVSRKGIAICLIEHKMKMVMELCERIIVLNYGEKIAEGNADEISHNEKAIKAYLGDEYAA